MSPCQQLRLRQEYLSLVRNGSKKSTIRAGKKYFPKGLLLLKSEQDCVEVNVLGVLYKQFDQLTEQDAKNDGFDNIQELKRVLYSFYSNLADKDIVTIIHFEFL